MAINRYLSTITLNANELMLQSKDMRSDLKKKKEKGPYICCLQETYFRLKQATEIKQNEKDIPFKWKGDEKAVVAILLSGKTEFKTKTRSSC